MFRAATKPSSCCCTIVSSVPSGWQYCHSYRLAPKVSYERAEDQTEGKAAGHRGRRRRRCRRGRRASTTASCPGCIQRRVLEEAQNTRHPAARAAALPVDLGQQYRRVLHGAGGRHLRPDHRRRGAAEPGRADAGPAADRDQPLCQRPRQRSAGLLGRPQGRDGRGRHPHRRAQGARGPRARVARPAVHLAVSADPDADRRRSRRIPSRSSPMAASPSASSSGASATAPPCTR